MNAILMMIGTVLAVRAIWALARSQSERKSAAQEFSRNPIGWAATMIAVAALLTCFWGLMVRPIGEIPVGAFKLWQVAAVTTLASTIVMMSMEHRGRK
jgi:hypothetical protein